jgi:DNA ligase-associated metallophosphoesterase
MTQEISLQGEQLHLLPERAVWWPAKRAMILSDVHWGKSAHFRKHGIPMPGSTQQHDAVRLAAILRHYRAEQLIIAGDLFHSRHNSEVDDFTHWRKAHAQLHIHFVMGNHDILSPQFYHSLNFEVHRDGLVTGPFYIAHDDAGHEGLYTIHGHLHPGVSLRGLGVKAVSLPCFAIGAHAMILPAFGRFTGCKRIEPGHFRNVYVIGEEKVMQLI